MPEYIKIKYKNSINKCLENHQELKSGIIILNKDKKLIYYDSAAMKMLEWLNDSLLGRSIANFPLKEFKLNYGLPNGGILKSTFNSSKKFYFFKKVKFKDDIIDTGYIYTFTDYTEQMLLQQRLEYLSTVDGLTKVYNQITILKLTDQKHQEAKKNKTLFSITMLDVDNFKNINDTFGHIFGNKVLNKIGQLLNKYFKNTAYSYGRFGGDEFLIVSSNCDVNEYKVKLNGFLTSVSKIRGPNSEKINLKISEGTHYIDYLINKTTKTAEEAITKADMKMYQSKALKKEY